ncbi:MAG: hypothetical protein ACI9EF_003108 [Pseudohongiellaceae bacterium]
MAFLPHGTEEGVNDLLGGRVSALGHSWTSERCSREDMHGQLAHFSGKSLRSVFLEYAVSQAPCIDQDPTCAPRDRPL